LTTRPYFDNFELDIFDAGGPQCHFTTYVTIAVTIRTLSVYLFQLTCAALVKMATKFWAQQVVWVGHSWPRTKAQTRSEVI